MLKQRNSVKSPSPEEEGAAETTCDKLTMTHIPHPPVLLQEGKEVKNSRVKLSLGRREGGGGGCFKIWCYFSSSSSDLTDNKLK